MAEQPIPTVSSADVARVVRRDFSGQEATVLALLNAYEDRESHRVRLAVLKLAAGNTDQVRRLVECAKRDYRDVISWAEYPAYAETAPRSLTETDAEQIIAADWSQYQQWLLP
jgi:hypothetical protein